jgi:DnaJ-like protein
MSNRRNLYRILHVQPEAPLEVIKASYRSLMTQLKAHPDLGGDHASAVLINQAYAVLSDPIKRKQYDKMIGSRKSLGRIRRHTPQEPIVKKKSSRPFRSSGYQTTRDINHSDTVQQKCMFCGTDIAVSSRANQYCSHCESPLLLIQPIPNIRLHELFGRRASPRIKKVGVIVIYPSWPHSGYTARLRDLSLFGISMLTDYSAGIGQVLKFSSSGLKGVARVVSVRANGANFFIHASFLTADFEIKSGVFVMENV